MDVVIISSEDRAKKEEHRKKLSKSCYEDLKKVVCEIADDKNIAIEEVIFKGTLKRIAKELVFSQNAMLDVLIEEARKVYHSFKNTALNHFDEMKIPLLMKQNLDLVYDLFRPIVFYYFLKSISQ